MKESSKPIDAYKNPFDRAYQHFDTPPKGYSAGLLHAYEMAGMVSRMKRGEALTILATSTAAGVRDAQFCKDLEAVLTQYGTRSVSTVILSDFTTNDHGTIIEQPQQYPHLRVSRMVADDRMIPLGDASVDVVQQRLGSLYHAAEDDRADARMRGDVPDLQGVKAILAEFLRVLKVGGVLVFDAWADKQRVQSTVDMMHTDRRESYEDTVGSLCADIGVPVEVSVTEHDRATFIVVRKL